MLKTAKAIKEHIQITTQCANALNIVVAALRDLEIDNLSSELHTINGMLADSIWALENELRKLEE